MEIRRATYAAAIRLAVVFSVAAVALALALESVGDLSVGAFVAVVAMTGFTTSWVQTGRIRRAMVPARRVHSPGPHRLPVA